jgi:hypothetical protein
VIYAALVLLFLGFLGGLLYMTWRSERESLRRDGEAHGLMRAIRHNALERAIKKARGSKR